MNVTADEGDGYVFVDYLPAEGTPYTNSQYYHFDNCGPAIIKAELDYNNRWVTITWNEPVQGYPAGNPVDLNDLNVILHNNGGTVTKVQIKEITNTANGTLELLATTMRVHLMYTPTLEVVLNNAKVTTAENLPADDSDLSSYKVPAGVETIEIVARENCVFDALANAASPSNTSDKLLLFDSKRPRVVSIVMGHDNYSAQILFSKRVFGDNKTLMGPPITALVPPITALVDDGWQDSDAMDHSNFTVKVIYSNKTDSTLELKNEGSNRSVIYDKGSNFVYLDFTGYKADANRMKLDVAKTPAPVSITIKFNKIVDKDDNPLVDDTITVPLWPQYQPGRPSLPPPMFTNIKDSYTYIKANPDLVVTKSPLNKQANGIPDAHSGVYAVSNGLIYYGIWYRDLDGDGRIDAIDLNYHNPAGTLSNPAVLACGSSAVNFFNVWVQNQDPDDIDNGDLDFYPADSEGVTWDNFPGWAAYPLDHLNGGFYTKIGTGNDSALYSFAEEGDYANYSDFNTNWTKVPVTGCQVVAQNINPATNPSSPDHRYSTLRVTIDQTKVRPRTHGKRFVMISYNDPRNVSDRNVNGSSAGRYNGCMIAGGKAPTNDASGAEYINYSDADETAGVYWKQTYLGGRSDSAGTNGRIDSYYIADAFGPAIAWDGAAPVPVTATAWRTNPYPKSGESDFTGYEYLDVYFSEPMAFAGDNDMAGCGYTAGGMSPDGVLHGAWGAEIIGTNTIRFKINGNNRSSLNFTFNGRLFDRSAGFYEKLNGQSNPFRASKSFSLRAIGVKMLDSRYKVLSQTDAVPMLTVDAAGASITNNSIVSSTTFPISVNMVELKSIEQGGDWKSTSASWVEGTANIGNVATTLQRNPGNARELLTYSMKANNLSTTVHPGSSVYGYISSIIARNDTYAGYLVPDPGSDLYGYFTHDVSTSYSPDPMGRGMGFSTASTPIRAALSGPVYSMFKVSPVTQTAGSARIQAEKTINVLGIDAAGSASYSIKSVTIRAIDTSYGQFDPEIDFTPLADGATSGVQLYDNNSGTVIKVANDGLEWSEWKTTEEGLPYKEVTLRPLMPASVPTVGGNALSFDFYIRVITSRDFNLGDSFVIQIPDDGVSFGEFSSVDKRTATWGTPNGGRGFAFTDYVYRDNNGDGRWAEGDAIMSLEDVAYPIPLYDGGKQYFTAQSTKLLSENGINIKNLYYAKKNWATNPASSPFYGNGNIGNSNKDIGSVVDLVGSGDLDLSYNVSYTPGDDIWYDIGGTPGVYDQGIDIPLFGNADKFPLPWQVAESGSKSAQYRAAVPASAGLVTDGYISAPSNGPVATVGLDMQDAGRGFGPRYILNGSVLVETISKNIAGGEYSIEYKAAGSKLVWNGGEATDIATATGGRTILTNADKSTFLVVRTLDNTLFPAADSVINFTVSSDVDCDIQQPAAITGVRIHAVGRGNVAGTTGILRRTGTNLSWKGGADVDVSAGGIFILNPASDDYIIVQVSQVGVSANGAESEELAIYSADGRAITPFLNISGLEIMAVSDMVPQGFYTFSYDGAGALSWGSGSPANVAIPTDEYQIVYGDGTNPDWPHNYVIVRRTAASLPAAACTDSLFINQSQLLRVAVTITGIRGFSSTHIKPMSNDENSGISLYWDANADGKFNTGDMYVKLLETPVLSGGGTTYTTTLTPDPAWLTAWLSCPQDSSFTTRGANFFVCVNTTSDMSYGDQFNVSASFYEPTEPNYVDGGVCFAAGTSGTVTCTSITNTVFAKLTTNGQAIDADTTIGLASIDHFLGTAIAGKQVYLTAVQITVHKPVGSTFTPDTAFRAMDETDPAARGIMLYADTNGNGKFDKNADTVVPCAIEVISAGDNGPWTYVLRPETSGGNSSVPQDDDDLPDHFIAVNLADTLPYGVSFYARMEKEAITYNTGSGNAAAAMVTDTLASTINSEYADLLDATMVTSTSGLVVNKIGSAVSSAYHNIALGYNVATNTYYLGWNGNQVAIDINASGTYSLGTGDNSIEVTFDPEAFFREDTLVCSDASGRPAATIKLGDKLKNLAGMGLSFFDENANGKYDRGETIAFAGNAVYGNADPALAVTPFTASAGLSFFDADGNGVYDDGESIFRDSDGVYSLPWAAHLIDSDNYVTAGKGGAAAGVTASTILVDASTISPAKDTPVTAGLYLYFIDVIDDGIGYNYAEDILVARSVTADGNMDELTFGANDKVVFDAAYEALEDKATYTQPAAGTPMSTFSSQDYLKFRQGGTVPEAYEQGDSLFISFAEQYSAPAFTWTIRVDKERKIRTYNSSAPAPFNEARKSLTAIAGLDIANSGATDVKLTSLTVRFVNVATFTLDDLRALTDDENSGVQLWRDLDGNGIFNADIDQLVPLASAPTAGFDSTNYLVTFSPASANEISNVNVDGIYDFFVVVQPSETSNNKLKVDNGDKFSIKIYNTDVVLNKTLNKTASLDSGVITIDSRAPILASDAVIADSDKDGYLETLTMVFDEKLRPGMLDDLSIWQIVDQANGKPITVTNATLSEDYLTISLTLSGADLETSTGPVSLLVKYNAENALLDWAGNPVEFRVDTTISEGASTWTNYIATGDTVAPRIMHTGVTISANEYDELTVIPAAGFFFHDRNGDNVWNAGEDIWYGDAVFAANTPKVWNGGNAWTTELGYTGKTLDNAYLCDANEDGIWNNGEFLWLEFTNPADAVYDPETDIAVPLNRTEEIAVLDSNADGFIDALEVWFSEALNDASMSGYISTQDSFPADKWVLAGHANMKAWRQGLDTAAFKDNLNDNRLFFSFDISTQPDTDSVPGLIVNSGETLADIFGNKLNAGAAYGTNALTLADHAKPVLLSVVSSNRVDAAGELPAGTVITLTFSEPLTQYLAATGADLLKDFEIAVDGVTLTAFETIFTAANGELAADGKQLVVTLVDATSGWASTGVFFSIVPDAADTIFGDAAGNNLHLVANMPVQGIDAADPTTFVAPVPGKYIRDDSDTLAVQIHYGDNDELKVTVDDWKLELFNLANPDVPVSEIHNDGTHLLAEFAVGETTTDFELWSTLGNYAYQLKLTLTIGGEDKVFTCNFFYSAEADVKNAGIVVNDGTGADVDEVLASDGILSANWSDFAKASGLPAAAYYKYAFSNGSTGEGTSTSASATGLTLTVGTSYSVTVEAYDADNVLLATAVSDGAIAVEELTDSEPPVMTVVNNTNESGTVITRTTSDTTLSAAWTATDNVAVTGYQYRIVKGAGSSAWSEDTGSLSTRRTEFASATVNGKVWAIGGYDGNVPLASVEIYDPANRQWTVSTNSLNEARYVFGKDEDSNVILVAGGRAASGVIDTIETCDKATGVWTTLADKLTTARYGAAVINIADGIFWVIGGSGADGVALNSIEVIDLNAGTVSNLAVTLSEARSGFQAVRQIRADGTARVLVIGGSTSAGASNVIDVINVTEPVTSTTLALATARRSGFAVVAVPVTGSSAQDIWVMGGYDNSFEPIADVEKIEANNAVTALASMTAERAQFAAQWLDSAEAVLVAGGYDADGNEIVSFETADRFGTLWSINDMALATGHARLALAIAGNGDNQRIVAFGGTTDGKSFTAFTESRRLVEVVKTWTDCADDHITVDGLSLNSGDTYIFEVKAKDAEENWSAVKASAGVTVETDMIIATLTCTDLPENNGSSAALNYSITVGGTNVTQYRYTIDGGAWSEWTAVADKLELTLALGSHTLQVVGKSAVKEQAETSATAISWTVVAPVATIVSGLPAENGYSSETAPAIVIGGTGLDGYKYRISNDNGATWNPDWTDVADMATAIQPALAFGNTYKLEVVGVADGVEGAATSRNWHVTAPGLNLVFAPLLPADASPAAADTFTVTLSDSSGTGNVDNYKYVLKDAEGNVVQGDDTTEISLGTAIQLNGLAAGSYTLEAKGHQIAQDEWHAEPTVKAFAIAAATAAFTPELAVSNTTDYDVTVNLNGLTGGYKYQLDGEAEQVMDAADLTFHVGPLSTGTHTLQLWGKDGADSFQNASTVYTINVKSDFPVGDRLTATLEADASVKLPADIDVTLTFSNILMDAPAAADFTVENATVTSIVKNALDAKIYTVTLTPDALGEGVNQQYVTIKLNADSVYDKDSGNANAASNIAKILVFNEALISLSMDAVEVNQPSLIPGETAIPETGVKTGEYFAIKVMANTGDIFRGGDLKLRFDTAKFQLVAPLNDVADVDAAAAIQAPFNTIAEACVVEWIEESGVKVGVRFQGAAAENTENNQFYAVLVFKAIGAGAGADTDFVLSAGNSGIVLTTYGTLAPADPAISYGVKQLPVTFEPQNLTLSLAEDTVAEGGSTTLTVALDYALDVDLNVTVNGNVYTITAGDTSVSGTVDGKAEDTVLTGDQTETFEITDVTPAGLVTTDSTVTLTTTDDEVSKLTFSVDYDEIEEGECVQLSAQLSDGATAGKDMAFNVTYSGMTSGTDFIPSGILTIANGAASGFITINTYADGIVNEDKTLNISVASLVNGGEPVTFQITVLNADVLPGDLAGGNDGESVNKVDFEDLTVFLSAYGLSLGEEGYIAAADYHEDGVIDFDDLVIFLSFYGTSLDDATRNGGAEATRAGAGKNLNLSLEVEGGNTNVNVGDIVTVKIFASFDFATLVGPIRADVHYTPELLKFKGEFAPQTCINSSVYNLTQEGTLYDASGLIDNLSGAGLAYPGQVANNKVLFASFQLEVMASGNGSAEISLDDFVASGTGATTEHGTLNVNFAGPLVFNIGDARNVPEFKFAFETEYSDATRGSDKELILGMKNGASVDYVMADGDSQEGPVFPGIYSLAFVETGRDNLKWDIRGLATTQTWTIKAVVPAGKTLTLDWSDNLTDNIGQYSMPNSLDFTMEFGSSNINMRTAANKAITLGGGEHSFRVTVTKTNVATYSQTYELEAGWNLIGAPFDFDAASNVTINAFQVMAYDPAQGVYYTNSDASIPFKGGNAYWVFVPEARLGTADELSITVTGTLSAKTGIELVAGWNLVTPLYSTSSYANPADGSTIQTVWYWEEDGYEWLEPNDRPQPGVGYWLNSTTGQTIWQLQ